MECNACGGSYMKRRSRQQADISLLECPICGFIVIDLSTWQYPYSDSDYYASIDKNMVNPEREYVKYRVRGIEKHVAEGRVVDLGCGLGETAIALSRKGFEVHGVEESSNAVRYLSSHFPAVKWHNEAIPRFLEGKISVFDVISLFHVLEHIPKPNDVCRLAISALRPNGLLVVEVPDVSGGQARLRGSNWQHWLPHHVNYFSLVTLRRLFESLGVTYIGSELKYHLRYPQGIWWRDATHSLLAKCGMNDVITTYWRKR